MDNKSNIDIQKSVRDNCEDLKNEILQLNKWEKEIKMKEKEQKKAKEIDETLQPLKNGKFDQKLETDKYYYSVDTSAQLKEIGNDIKDKYNDILKTFPQSVANIEKDKGNNSVKCQDYQQGIFFYTKAIEIYNMDPVYFSNRAFCYLKLERYKDCVADCDKSIQLDNKSVKAYFRRMKANEMLGNIDDALNDCIIIKKMEPTNNKFKNDFTHLLELKRMSSSSKGTQNSIIKDSEKNFDETDIRTWLQTQETLGKIDFVEKSPTERSKKTLKNIEISEISSKSDPYSTIKNDNDNNDDSDTIPDEIVDQLFNNATGESNVSKKRSYGQNRMFTSQSTSDFIKPPPGFEFIKPIPKSFSTNELINKNPKQQPEKINHNEIDVKENKKEHDGNNKNKENENEKKNLEVIPSEDPIEELPKTGVQFISTWKELNTSKKYSYLNAINQMKIQQIDKIFESCLDMDLLSEILDILNVCFIKNCWPVLNILKSICKHDEMTIFSLMFSEKDKMAINNIFEYLKSNNSSLNDDDMSLIKKKLLI